MTIQNQDPSGSRWPCIGKNFLSFRLMDFQAHRLLKARYFYIPVLLFFLLAFPHHNLVAITDYCKSPRYEPRFFPVDASEKTLYRASWGGIPIGKAKINASPVWQGGKKFYRVRIKANTLIYLHLIFKMRDTIESVIDADTLRPRRFIFEQRENNHKAYTEAVFDPKSNKWVIDIKKKKKVKHHEFISPNTLDPVSAAYLIRSLDFKVGDHFQLCVFVGGKKRYPLILDIVGKERITIEVGVFDAYKIHLRLEKPGRSGKPSKFRQADVWLSADEKRLLLKASIKILLGSFNIELMKTALRSN